MSEIVFALFIFFNIGYSVFLAPTILNPLSFFSIGWLFPAFISFAMSDFYKHSFTTEFSMVLLSITLIMQFSIMLPLFAIKSKRIRILFDKKKGFDIQERFRRKIASRSIKRYYFLLFCSLFFLVFSYIDIGTVPALNPAEYKESRVLLRESFFYKLYTISLIAVPLLVYFKTQYKIRFSVKTVFMLAAWFICTALTGWTGNIAYPIIMSIAAYSLALKSKSEEKKPIVISLAAILVFFLFISYLRSVFNLGLGSGVSTLLDQRTWGRVFLYFSFPFYNLEEIYYASELRSYGANLFYFLSRLPFFGHEISVAYENWFEQFQSEMAGENIYKRGANTLTFIAPLYFDFGVYGALVISALLGVFFSLTYLLCIEDHSSLIVGHWKVALYASMSMVVFMLFTGLHTRMLSFYIWPIIALFFQFLARYRFRIL